jgi:hypothetical protein
MISEKIYGILCSKEDESQLITRVNAYLATFNRTTSKANNKSMLDGYLPFVLKYFYWNLNKDTGTWFELFLNEDSNGKYFFPNHKDYGWLMRIRIDIDKFPAATPEKAKEFISGLFSAIEFSFKVIRENDTFR